MDNTPYVSVIIPVRNEESYISKCLNSILNQDYKKDKIEVLIIDGMSEDGTVQKIRQFLNQTIESGILSQNKNQEIEKKQNTGLPDIRILKNPKKVAPCGLNIGIREAKGDYIIRMDAHTEYAPDYVSKCIEWLKKTGAKNAGGPMRAVENGYVGKAITLAHHSKFGLGGGKFHNKDYSGYMDTVYLGAWPRKVFEELGLFDERLVRNQDIEFNARIRKAGGDIYMTPEIKSYYYCRDTLNGLWKQNFENGKWVVYTKKITSYCLSWRHFIPLIFVISLMVSGVMLFISSQLDLEKLFSLSFLLFAMIVASYILTNLFFSAVISLNKGLKYFFILPIVFAALHFSYGLGSILGILTLKKWLNKNR